MKKEQLQEMFNEMLNRKLNESWEKPWFVPVNKNSAVTNYKTGHQYKNGNFIFLLYLELDHHLSEVVPKGLAATMEFLQRHGMDSPFLVMPGE